jgi:hypothetical protein
MHASFDQLPFIDQVDGEVISVKISSLSLSGELLPIASWYQHGVFFFETVRFLIMQRHKIGTGCPSCYCQRRRKRNFVHVKASIILSFIRSVGPHIV